MFLKKKLGIIGGMGPEATVTMFNKIVTMCDASNDQEHIEIFIHNNTNIPDRTKAILYGGPSPLEGTNNKIKTMKRMAYGFRDMEFFKLKIMGLHETKYALIG